MAELNARRRKLVSLIAADRGDSRITIRETDNGLGIRNPSRKFMPLILFLLLWLGGWSVGEYFALSEIFGSGSPLAADMFLIVWVSFWTLGGLAAWWFVLWQLFGVEQLFLTGEALVHDIGLWKLRRRRIFPLSSVHGFVDATGRPKMGQQFTNGVIAFQVDGKEHRFGMAMSKEEAELSLAAIKRHFTEPDRQETEITEPDWG